jgi:hypothetical protein
MGKDCGYGQASRCRFNARVGTAILFAAGIAGCTSIVSQKPIFSDKDFEKSDGVLGIYDAQTTNPSEEFEVTRESAGKFRAIGLGQDKQKWFQFFYADFSAIPLGGGDYVLQVSCSLMADDKGWKPAPTAMTKGYSDFALVLKDRRVNAYWSLANFQDTTPALLARYGAVDPSVRDPKQDSSIRILPASMSKEKAIAFFRDLAADTMNNANGNPGIIERRTSGPQAIDPTSDEAKAITVRTAQQCQSMTRQHRP